MSSETPGVSSSSGENVSPISSMPRVRSISDEITIYEITAPIPSKPTLKPLSFDLPQEPSFFKTSPIKMSPQRLSPLSTSGNQNTKILSPTSLSIHTIRDRSRSPCDQLPQFVSSPSSQHVLLIPSKPELTVTVVSSPTQSDSLTQSITSVSPVSLLPIPHPSTSTVESPKIERDVENVITSVNPTTTPAIPEEVPPVRKRQKRVFMPLQQKTMYRTRTMVKASLAAQNEKDELACPKVKNEVPSVKPSAARALNLSLPSPPLPTYRSGRKRTQRKLSTAEQLQQLKEDRSIDLENPGSILKLINLKNVLTRHNFNRLPLEDQIRLLSLLPDVDTVSEPGKPDQPSEDAFDNLFYNKACEDWKTRLIAGDFTPEQKQKQKLEDEREKAKVDPWKKKHFEPIWGFSDVKRVLQRSPPEPPKLIPTSTITKPEPAPATPQPLTPVATTALVESSVIEAEPEVIVLESTEEAISAPNLTSVPQQSPPTPGKRDSAHFSEESPILSKRLCRTVSGAEPETQASLDTAEVPISMEPEESSATPDIQVIEVEEILRVTPIPPADNEVTIENSPYESSSSLPEEVSEEEFVLQSVEQMIEDEYKAQEDLTVVSEPKVESETVEESKGRHEFEAKSHMIEDLPTLILSEEKCAEGSDSSPEECTFVEQLYHCFPPTDNGQPEVKVNVELIPSEINTKSEVHEGSFELKLEEPEIQTPLEDIQEILQEQEVVIVTKAQTESRLQTTSEGESHTQFILTETPSTQVIQISAADLVATLNESLSSAITNLNVATQAPPVTVPSSCHTLTRIPSPVVTAPVPLVVPAPPDHHMVVGDRPPKPVILRMVSIAPPTGPVVPGPMSSSSVRLPLPPAPVSQAQFQPTIVVKSMSPIGGKMDSIRNLVPIGALDLISVQPRTLAGLGIEPKVGPVVQTTTTIGSLTKVNGNPGISGSIHVQSPGSPNVSLNNRKNPRQKPARQPKPKNNVVPPGTVNMDRSYAICSAVVQNSPNREKLQAKLVKPPPLTPNHRIARPELVVPTDGNNTVIHVSRRASTPTGLQSTVSGPMGMGSGQKMMLVNNHQGMAPLIRPIQQLGQAVNHHQIVVSTPNTTGDLGGSRALGMNVTYTKHNPPTNNQTTTSTHNVITHQQLAAILQQQGGSITTQRQGQPMPSQRHALFVSRSPQHQSTPHVRIVSQSQLPAQPRLVPHQILQFQQSRRLSQDQFPIRTQIMTSNGETMTIHRAGGSAQGMRVTPPMRPTVTAETVKLCSTTPSLTLIGRSNSVPENSRGGIPVVQNYSGESNPAQNLADFTTNQWTALSSSLRPISPLTFESDRGVVQRTPTKSREGFSAQNSSLGHQVTEMFVSTNHLQRQDHIGLSDLMGSSVPTTVLDPSGNSFSILKQHKNPEFIQLDRDHHRGGGGGSTQNGNTNHNFTRTVPEGSFGQGTQLDGQQLGGMSPPQQHYVIVQTTGSNGMPQSIVLTSASLVMSQQQKDMKDHVDIPRAASAPPNPGIVIGQPQQQLTGGNLQETSFQDFPAIRVVAGNDDIVRMNYGLGNNSPATYTLAPITSANAGTDPNILRVIRSGPTSSGSPDWNCTPGHQVVNVNLNGSSGSARIIPGQPPVISIPDTTNGSSSCSGMSSDFDLFSLSAIATGNESSVKLENNSDTPILIPVSMMNNNRQHFQPAQDHHRTGGGGSNRSNCVCDLRAMTPCGKCGAFSHSECMKNGLDLCMRCVIR